MKKSLKEEKRIRDKDKVYRIDTELDQIMTCFEMSFVNLCSLLFRLTAYIEKDPETSLYVAIVPGIPGAHTQAATLDELQENLKEVLELVLEEMEPENYDCPSSF
ncbi:MAG: hypothetical protein C00003105_00467 [ANME-2 cluster archaeon HR1]|nr:MAG: hypothetical protein C00003105_00467 [ANME-2 cluster archaeon HR1]